jgi:hypothetical protein
MPPVKQPVLPRLALLALIWGSSFLWIKLADRGFSPAEVTFARLALGVDQHRDGSGGGEQDRPGRPQEAARAGAARVSLPYL